MDSEAQENKLPIIKFTAENLIQGTNSWISTSNEVRRALEEYGCFSIHTDQMSPILRNTMFDSSKQLYDLPSETKMKNTSEVIGFGYGSNFPTMPILEYFGVEGATFEAIQKFTNLLWPSGNTSFGENLLNYTKILTELDATVMRMVCGSYGVDEYKCEDLVSSSLHLVRFLKYRRPEKEEVETGLHPHTDKAFLAVLDTNEVRGLEIETRDGRWVTYDPSPSTFLVIAGEAFMGWSNGKIYAPLHQVTMKYETSKQIRYTIATFSFMRSTIEVPKELLEDEDSLKFKPFNHFDFIPFCVGEGKKFKWAINAYCGTTA